MRCSCEVRNLNATQIGVWARRHILFIEEPAFGVSFTLQMGLKPLIVSEFFIAFCANPFRHLGR